MRRLTPFGATQAAEVSQLLMKADKQLRQASTTTLAAYYVNSAADSLDRAVDLLAPSVFPGFELTLAARRNREHTDRACEELREKCKGIASALRKLGVKDGQSLNDSAYAQLNKSLGHLERMAKDVSQTIQH